MANNPIKNVDPEGDFFLLFSKVGYEFQKRISPVALKLNFGRTRDGGFHFGFETSVGIPKNAAYSYRFHSGREYYSSGFYDGISGSVKSNGREVTYLGMMSLASTTYKSNDQFGNSTDQTTGTLTLGGMLWNIGYQNDWWPKLLRGNLVTPGIQFGDGGDRFRSAALQYNFLSFKFGFNLFTGDPGLKGSDRSTGPGSGRSEGKRVFTSGTINRYRVGIAYFGLGPLRIGTNSEWNRHIIQNKFAHDFLRRGKDPHIEVLPIPSTFYWYFGSGFGSGFW